jgi:hypothetical protein
MKCTLKNRLGRISGNFGVSFLTPLIGINITNSITEGNSIFLMTVFQAFLSAVIYTGLSVSKEVRDESTR